MRILINYLNIYFKTTYCYDMKFILKIRRVEFKLMSGRHHGHRYLGSTNGIKYLFIQNEFGPINTLLVFSFEKFEQLNFNLHSLTGDGRIIFNTCK